MGRLPHQLHESGARDRRQGLKRLPGSSGGAGQGTQEGQERQAQGKVQPRHTLRYRRILHMIWLLWSRRSTRRSVNEAGADEVLDVPDASRGFRRVKQSPPCPNPDESLEERPSTSGEPIVMKNSSSPWCPQCGEESATSI